jgi:RHS repeat-associated protein
VQIVYDGDGNRVSEGSTKYLVDDQTPTGYAQVTEELVSGAVTAQFTYGPMRISQNRAGTLSYYGYDPGGSVRELLNSSGTVTDTYEYDAFGNPVAQSGSTTNEFQYRGEQFDASLQMYYIRARYYIPKTGRFLTADKYEGEEVGACDCANRSRIVAPRSAHHFYEYSDADPINLTDPGGRDIVSYSILFGRGELQATYTAARIGGFARCIFSLEWFLLRNAQNGRIDLDDPYTDAALVSLAWSCGSAFNIWPFNL